MRNAIHSHTPLRHALSSIQMCKHVSETVETSGRLPCRVRIVLIFDGHDVVDDCENVIVPCRVLDPHASSHRNEHDFLDCVVLRFGVEAIEVVGSRAEHGLAGTLSWHSAR